MEAETPLTGGFLSALHGGSLSFADQRRSFSVARFPVRLE
jgi:hypothetical protein